MKKYHNLTLVDTLPEEHDTLVRQQKVWITEAGSECKYDAKQATKYYKLSGTISPEKQHSMAADLQKTWSDSAKRDAKNLERHAELFRKEGRLVLARGYLLESKWSMFWYERRKNLSRTHKELAKRDHRHPFVLYDMYMQEQEWCADWIKRREKVLEAHMKYVTRKKHE